MSEKALVLGMGASGIAAAKLLVRRGYAVRGLDRGAARPGLQAFRAEYGVDIDPGDNGLPPGDYALAVVSPGVPADSPWIKASLDRGISVISELELGFRHSRAPVLAVTGSNGKSTVVKLCGEAMAAAGRRVAVGGNYGVPFCDLVDGDAADWLILEVSSFQLEWVESFRPRVGILLNVFANHLDRHGDMATYKSLKMRMLSRMGTGDTVVVPPHLLGDAQSVVSADCNGLTFGTHDADFEYRPGTILTRSGRLACRMDGSLFDNPVLGPHAAAAYAALTAAEVSAEVVAASLAGATPLPHRMSKVAVIGGVTYVNDSKATNLTSMSAALKMCVGPVLLIAGGLLKEKNMELPKEQLANRARRVYLIGDASERMLSAWKNLTDCVECGTLERAVNLARSEAREGDVVLLSPGCASFDQFSGFVERGEQFERFVRSIEGGERE